MLYYCSLIKTYKNDSKIIVTGGCGYIGSHTVIELIDAGFEVLIIDDLSNSSRDSLERIKSITGVFPNFVELNFADEDGFEFIAPTKSYPPQ